MSGLKTFFVPKGNHAVWKYPLQIVERQRIPMPRESTILTVQAQNGVPTIWAVVDEKSPVEARIFWVYGTGRRIPAETPPIWHVGTVQIDGFVWHVFESAS